jgi:hypothetical protein
MGLYEIYKFKQCDVVMLGDSRTHGCNWNALLGRNSIMEMGIASDVIDGFISRLNYVYRVNPKVVFVEGGVNDIYNWKPVDYIFERYIDLIKQLQSKKITVVVQSTMLVALRYPSSDDRNKEIIKLDNLLSDYCKKIISNISI